MASENPAHPPEPETAIVAVTANGVRLALLIQGKLPGSVCYAPARHRFAAAMGARPFDRLASIFPEVWRRHRSLICIMATGIAVRLAAPLLRSKTKDPAVVVLDERGQFAISLVSGHMGGANALAASVAEITGGLPVITTSSDVCGKPALDLIARENDLEVGNPAMLSRLARAILEEEPFWVFDPDGLVIPALRNRAEFITVDREFFDSRNSAPSCEAPGTTAGLWVSESDPPRGFQCLALHPRRLVIGIGCNRGTNADEILELVRSVFISENLARASIRNLASVDLKSDEPGLIEAAHTLRRPVVFFAREQIESVAVPNPSGMVEKHLGVQSVCEATALLSAKTTGLVVPKQKSLNATLAVARANSPL